MAVGKAKQLGASKFTAVCSTKDVDKVKGLGPDEIIDRKATPIEHLSSSNKNVKYDVIFDASGLYSFFTLKSLLKPNGRVVSTLPHIDSMLFGSWLYPFLFRGKFSKMVLCRSNRADLQLLASLLESKAVHVSIDSVHDVKNFQEAWTRQDDREKTGRVLIKIDGGW